MLRRRLALLALPLLAGAAAPAAPKSWYRMLAADGSQIGWSSREVRQTPRGRETVSEQEMLLENDAATSNLIRERTVVTEDAAGRVVSIVEQSQAGRGWTRQETRISGLEATVTRKAAGDRRVERVTMPPGIRFDGGAALLSSWNPQATPRLEFDQLAPGGAAIEHVVIERVAAPAGEIAALRRRYEAGELRGVARLALAPDGRILAVTQPMFGTNVTTASTDEATALKPHGPYRVLRSVVTRAPVRIPDAALKGHIRYRFSFRDGIAFDVPETGEQRARQAAGGGIELDVCPACGSGLPRDRATLAAATRPTAWMQSDSPRLRAIAAPVGRMKTTDTRKMELLLARARPYLARIDFTGHYSALETLSRKAGDCTEAAVLLAALGRAAGIPTRVANGIVYSRQRYHGVSNAFLPHSWTIAYVDGAWRSFDLALDTFDATHIALTVGDGDARSLAAAGQLASLLQWEGLSEIRPRPAS